MARPASVLCFSVLVALGQPVVAADELGEREFMVACATCHGESAKGAGPFAQVLNLEVPSLTGLAAANDGVFPFLETLMIIDGRSGVRGHGGPMPIWGDRYEAAAVELAGTYGAEAIVRGKLLSLVYYLESIQE